MYPYIARFRVEPVGKPPPHLLLSACKKPGFRKTQSGTADTGRINADADCIKCRFKSLAASLGAETAQSFESFRQFHLKT
jgi:hypothetical protein